jgi:hypothetical protein
MTEVKLGGATVRRIEESYERWNIVPARARG